MLNPSDQQEKLVAYNEKHDIISEAYSPLGTGKIFEIKELADLASKYNKSVAQIVLNWSLAKGFLPLPKSVHQDRIIENTKIFDFKLTEDDIKLIDSLHGQAGLASNPDQVDF
jgi:diketogulonate reductase-like aldo/keto reductase